MWGPGLCGCLCKPCIVQIQTKVCSPGGGAAIAKDGVTVVLKDGGGTTVGTAVSSGQVGSITLINHGTGYTSAPAVAISAPPAGGTPATAVATISAGSVVSVTLTDPGAGYTAAPTIGLSGGGGSGATASLAFARGVRFPVSAAGTFTGKASLGGYRDNSASVVVTTCSGNLWSGSVTLDTAIAGWPVTPLSGTDSVFGAFTLTNGGSYTTTVTRSGRVREPNCSTTDTGSFLLTYQLLYTTCGIQLLISWPACDLNQCTTGLSGPGNTLSGTPPRGTGFVGATPTCGGIACVVQMTLAPTTVQSGPLLLTFAVPAMGTTCFGEPWPYPSGGTITLTP